MPRSFDLRAYPQEFRECAEGVAYHRKEYDLEFPDYRGANKWRGKFYAFSGAAARAAARDNASPEEKELANAVIRCMVTMRQHPDGSVTLTVQDRDNCWHAQVLRTARVRERTGILSARDRAAAEAEVEAVRRLGGDISQLDSAKALGLVPQTNADGTAPAPTERSTMQADAGTHREPLSDEVKAKLAAYGHRGESRGDA